jgi:hypothetical protein
MDGSAIKLTIFPGLAGFTLGRNCAYSIIRTYDWCIDLVILTRFYFITSTEPNDRTINTNNTYKNTYENIRTHYYLNTSRSKANLRVQQDDVCGADETRQFSDVVHGIKPYSEAACSGRHIKHPKVIDILLDILLRILRIGKTNCYVNW